MLAVQRKGASYMLKLNQITKTYTVGDMRVDALQGHLRGIPEERIRIGARPVGLR